MKSEGMNFLLKVSFYILEVLVLAKIQSHRENFAPLFLYKQGRNLIKNLIKDSYFIYVGIFYF